MSKWCSIPGQGPHRDDDVRAVDEIRQLGDELAAEDRDEAALDRRGRVTTAFVMLTRLDRRGSLGRAAGRRSRLLRTPRLARL